MKPDSTIYRGVRHGKDTGDECTIYVDDVAGNSKVLQLRPSQKLCNHSPTGFNWGYGGSGPAQLALGLLLDFTQDKDTALANYDVFLRDFVARWDPAAIWSLTGRTIREWLDEKGITSE